MKASRFSELAVGFVLTQIVFAVAKLGSIHITVISHHFSKFGECFGYKMEDEAVIRQGPDGVGYHMSRQVFA